jgi:hypothetical protein
MAYGPTGSGKTYTMDGPAHDPVRLRYNILVLFECIYIYCISEHDLHTMCILFTTRCEQRGAGGGVVKDFILHSILQWYIVL